MQTIEPSSESIENLVIDKDELNTIRALSNQQSSKIDSWSADFIAGKGSGQIILLHGMDCPSTVVGDTNLTWPQVLRESERLIPLVCGKSRSVCSPDTYVI